MWSEWSFQGGDDKENEDAEEEFEHAFSDRDSDEDVVPPILSGTLAKKHWLRKTWKQFWFELYADRLLYAKHEGGKIVGRVDLDSASRVLSHESGDAQTFTLCGRRSDVVLRAADREKLAVWAAAVASAADRSPPAAAARAAAELHRAVALELSGSLAPHTPRRRALANDAFAAVANRIADDDDAAARAAQASRAQALEDHESARLGRLAYGEAACCAEPPNLVCLALNRREDEAPRLLDMCKCCVAPEDTSREDLHGYKVVADKPRLATR
ncbi:hypothetical protein M885DRAFT_611407 [Pelagophyceae sp. CCMP2097]|nr:hypothetical protein M885DRAFT_611407 [Pelagophyceae sp. CCMP2097]